MRTYVSGSSLSLGMLLALPALLVGCEKKKAAFDLSSPQGAAMTFAKAIEAGDADTAKRAAIAGGIEVDMIDAMADATRGITALRGAATRKFGAAEVQRILDPHRPPQLSLMLIDADAMS